jgi:uncharacterized membrane protein
MSPDAMRSNIAKLYLSNFLAGLVFFYLATFSYGIVQNEAQAMVQKRLDSSVRATALSLINFGTSSLMIPLGLAFGALAQHYSVFTAYQMFACIGLVYLVIWPFWHKRVEVQVAVPVQVEPVVLV